MKAAVVVVACLFFAASSEAQWNEVNPFPSTTWDIEFSSSTAGWIVGNSGIIMKTTTGGKTWTKRSSGTSEALRAIFFVDPMNGTVVGSNGTILRTTNGGDTWLPGISNTQYNLYDVFFVDQNIGLITGAGGIILKTTDGGISWVQKNSGVTNILNTIWFTSQQNGIVSRPGSLLRTTDGGETWFQAGTLSGVYSFAFADEYNGVAAGTDIYKSTDGGISWFQTAGFTGLLTSAVCIDENNYAAAGSAGIYRSTDGGSSWYPQFGINYPYVLTIGFSDFDHGIALGIDRFFLKTTDSGNTWTERMGTYTDQALNAVIDVGSVKFLTVGNQGTIAVSTDSGINWNLVNSGTSKNLYGISMIDLTTAVAVGDSGIILKSSDSGSSWEIENSGLISRLRAVSFPAGSTSTAGYAVGDIGMIIKTTNNGVNWVQQNSGITDDLYSVCFIDDMTGFACGDHGKILNTTNGGTDWFVTQTSAVNILHSISFYKELPAYGNAVGESGTLLRTTDGGITWIQQYSGQFYNFYGVALTNTSIGFLCADSGFIMKTVNAGANWYEEESYDGLNLFSIAVANNSSNVGIAVGESGTILRKAHAAIPVELNSFTAFAQGSIVILNWQTETETNNRGFEIQRKFNGSWVTVGFVNGHGTTTERHSYVYHDNLTERKGSVAVYRLKQYDFDGGYEYSDEIEITFASDYSLSQNYPNPFNPVTNISYQLPVKGFASLKLYNTLGEEVALLVNGEKEAGKHTIELDGHNLASGIYFYQLQAGSFVQTKKLVIMK